MRAPYPGLQPRSTLLVARDASLRAQDAILAIRPRRRLGRAHLLEVPRALASDRGQLELAAVGGFVVFVLVLRARAAEDAAAENQLEEGLERRDAGCDYDGVAFDARPYCYVGCVVCVTKSVLVC